MAQIIWKKGFVLQYQRDEFRVITLEDNHRLPSAIVIYYDRKETEYETRIEYKLKQFWGKTENDAYNQCIEWVNKNLGTEYKVTTEE